MCIHASIHCHVYYCTVNALFLGNTRIDFVAARPSITGILASISTASKAFSNELLKIATAICPFPLSSLQSLYYPAWILQFPYSAAYLQTSEPSCRPDGCSVLVCFPFYSFTSMLDNMPVSNLTPAINLLPTPGLLSASIPHRINQLFCNGHSRSQSQYGSLTGNGARISCTCSWKTGMCVTTVPS